MLHTLRPAPGSRHASKRIGRGDSSGHGKTATHGTKGQKARTGGSRGLATFAIRGKVLRIPKVRGFTSPKHAMAEVQLSRLVARFGAAGAVAPHQMVKANLVDSIRYGVKVIGSCAVAKPLAVSAHGFTRSAKAALIAGGGKAEMLPLRNA